MVCHQLQGKAVGTDSLKGNLDPFWRSKVAASFLAIDARHVRYGHGRCANAAAVADDAAVTYGLRNAAYDATNGPSRAADAHDAASHAAAAAHGLWTVANGHAATANGIWPAANGNVATANDGHAITAHGNAAATNGLRPTTDGNAATVAHGWIRTATHGRVRPAAPLLTLMKALHPKHALPTCDRL